MTTEREVQIAVDNGGVVYGDLAVPDDVRGIVVFAHGSGSGRHSPRNQMVAAHLRQRGFATLLIDLLTADEEAVDARTRHLRFDVGLLAGRLVDANAWLAEQPGLDTLPMGYFGASTGAAAALVAAARHPARVAAVVSRGGRPDLAGHDLPGVQARTLLIVGSRDESVIGLNKQAAERLQAHHALQIVRGATHLFEEPGAMEEVARLAGDWFDQHFRDPDAAARSGP